MNTENLTITNKSWFRLLSGAFLLVFALLPMTASAKKTYGLYEEVQLTEVNNATIKAKLDTGALTSSLGAMNISFFEKNGQDWIKFQPQVEGMELPAIEKEIVRYSRIKRRVDGSGQIDPEELFIQRPVIHMDICFDGHVYTIEVNLTDRSRFNYPLLLGSSALIEFKAVIDPSLEYQSARQCDLEGQD